MTDQRAKDNHGHTTGVIRPKSVTRTSAFSRIFRSASNPKADQPVPAKTTTTNDPHTIHNTNKTNANEKRISTGFSRPRSSRSRPSVATQSSGTQVDKRDSDPDCWTANSETTKDNSTDDKTEKNNKKSRSKNNSYRNKRGRRSPTSKSPSKSQSRSPSKASKNQSTNKTGSDGTHTRTPSTPSTKSDKQKHRSGTPLSMDDDKSTEEFPHPPNDSNESEMQDDSATVAERLAHLRRQAERIKRLTKAEADRKQQNDSELQRVMSILKNYESPLNNADDPTATTSGSSLEHHWNEIKDYDQAEDQIMTSLDELQLKLNEIKRKFDKTGKTPEKSARSKPPGKSKSCRVGRVDKKGMEETSPPESPPVDQPPDNVIILLDDEQNVKTNAVDVGHNKPKTSDCCCVKLCNWILGRRKGNSKQDPPTKTPLPIEINIDRT